MRLVPHRYLEKTSWAAKSESTAMAYTDPEDELRWLEQEMEMEMGRSKQRRHVQEDELRWLEEEMAYTLGHPPPRHTLPRPPPYPGRRTRAPQIRIPEHPAPWAGVGFARVNDKQTWRQVLPFKQHCLTT